MRQNKTSELMHSQHSQKENESEGVKFDTSSLSVNLSNSKDLTPCRLESHNIFETPRIKESQVAKLKTQLEKKIILQSGDFKCEAAFATAWYNSETGQKHKLGKLFYCKVKDDESAYICRTINFDRVTSYQMDSYLTTLTVICMLRLQKFVLFPRGIHISETN